MEKMWDKIILLITSHQGMNIIKAFFILLIGYMVYSIITKKILKNILKRMKNNQKKFLIQKTTKYIIHILIFLLVLNQLGFNLNVLLGAAGVLSVAIGFASQTSASNLISGFFLIGEKPFQMGDFIIVGGETGEVMEIGLFSTIIRKPDNLVVRIPNETLMKSQITNLTKYPIRRVDIDLSVAYKEDLDKVKELLMTIIQEHPLALKDPEPLFIFKAFGASSLDMMIGVWAKRDNFLTLKNELQFHIKKKFDETGIEIPFPQLVVWQGDLSYEKKNILSKNLLKE